MAARGLHAGEEVAWSYGPRSNVELLAAYGFALPPRAAVTAAEIEGCADGPLTLLRIRSAADAREAVRPCLPPGGAAPEAELRVLLALRGACRDLSARWASGLPAGPEPLTAAAPDFLPVAADLLQAARGELQRAQACAAAAAEAAAGAERLVARRPLHMTRSPSLVFHLSMVLWRIPESMQ